MLKNYLKIAFRNLSNQKMYSLINISGLAIGIACFIIAMLYSDYNMTYDTFHKNSDRIYALTTVSKTKEHAMRAPLPMPNILLTELPNIEDATRYVGGGIRIVRYQDEKFYEGFRYVEDNFLTFFTFKMLSGNPETALTEPNTVVLTKSVAEKYFGEDNPIGKELTVDNNQIVTVTGVTEDIPYNSSIRYDILISWNSRKWDENWQNYCTAFVQIQKGAKPIEYESSLTNILNKYLPESETKPERMYLYPIEEIRLRPRTISAPYGWMTPVPFYIILGFGTSMLIVVCINFMNLATAKYINRAREVGLRRVVGAYRSQLIKQFLGESIIISLIALPIAILIYELVYPTFLTALRLNMSTVNMTLWDKPMLFIYVIGITILVGVISGIYPAIFMSKFKPVEVMRGKFQKGKKGTKIRKILVVSQFTIAIILIVNSIVTEKQFDLLLKVDLGYDRENVIAIPIRDEAKEKVDLITAAFSEHPNVKMVCGAMNVPMDWRSISSRSEVIPEGMSKQDAVRALFYPAAFDFIETLDMRILGGRSFNREYSDTLNSIVISKSMAEQLPFDDPIGKTLTMEEWKGTVIGIVEDFHFMHVFFKKAPAFLYISQSPLNYIFVKSNVAVDTELQNFLAQRWNELFPHLPFEYQTLDDRFNAIFTSTVKGKEIFSSFSVVTIIFSLLGLLGLASYTAERRTKEIAIRKVLGASMQSILKALVSSFLFLVILSNIIAWPIAIFCTNWFLEWAWAYKTNIGIEIYIFAAVSSLLAAIIAVIFQSSKAAIKNPVDSLRIE